MNTAIYSFIKKHSLINHGDTLIVGLSGGPDSVFLLHMLNQLRETLSLTLIAAHLNHGWRSDAQKDVLFCKDLCDSLNIPFESACAQDIPITINKNGSLEQLGRTLRRAYFDILKKKHNATAIALGHHQDDQIETFFIRLIRGTSLEGLGCIKPSHHGYIRPLLTTTKEEILAYLSEKNIPYCIDSTNESNLFLRNRIRALLPLFTECDNRFSKNILKTITHMQQVYAEMQTIINEKYLQIVGTDYNLNKIDVLLLNRESAFFQKQIIVQWLTHEKIHSFSSVSDTLLDEILRFLLSNRGGEHRLCQSWKIVKKQNKACIQKI